MRLFVLRSEPAFLHYYDPTKVSLQKKPLKEMFRYEIREMTWTNPNTAAVLFTPQTTNLTQLLFSPVIPQDDISPVGGFSLRSCLVSSLNDNGVPSGESN